MFSRYPCPHARVVVFIVLIGVISRSNCFTPVTYSCFTNGTLTVTNPNTAVFLSATAANRFGVCTVETTVDKGIFYVHGCVKNFPIAMTLSSRETAPSNSALIGGDTTEIHRLMCQEIPYAGVTFPYKLNIDVISETPAPLQPTTHDPVTPTFLVTSSIWDSDDVATLTSSYLGERVRWKITGPAEYDLLPVSCTAYAGLEVGAEPSMPLITDGCSLKTEYLSHFTETSLSSHTELFSWVYVFRFYTKSELTLACTVRVCTKGSSFCTLSCGSSGKKRSVLRPRLESHLDEVRGEGVVMSRLNVVDHLGLSDGSSVKLSGGRYSLSMSMVLLVLTCLR